MNKHVVFLPNSDYWDPMRNNFIKIKDIIVNPKHRNLLYRFHMSLKVNSYIKIPFKFLWLKKIFKNFSKNDEFFVEMIEGENIGLHKDALRWIKKKFPNVCLVYYCLNTIPKQSRFSFPKIDMLKKEYDYVLSFDKDDAKNNSFIYYEGIYSKYNRQFDDNIEYDLFFVGNNKGRIDELHKIYKELTQKNVRCLFYINNVSKNDIVYPEIHYNEKLSYLSVIELICKSKCILELIFNDRNNNSFRMWESFVYNKKILTNHKLVFDFDFYDNKRIKSIFSDANECANFILNDEI